MNSCENDSIMLVEFECPVCMNYMEPPIRMCLTGHNFCNDCFTKITKCPTCKAAKVDTRNYPLENIYEKMKFPCKFRENGCEFTGKARELDEHIKECYFRKFECPYYRTDLFNKEESIPISCAWDGNLINMEDHCRKDHEEDFRDNVGNGKMTEVVHTKRSTTTFIRCYNEFFMMKRNVIGKFMSLCLYHFGKKEMTKQFCIKINIKDKISIKSPCLSAQEYHKNNMQLGILVHIDLLNNFSKNDQITCVYQIGRLETY